MALALLLARLALAAVFAVAGLAKLADLPGSRRAVRGFGMPEPLARPLGLLLPPAELAVAAALVPRASARWGALGALALLLAFCAAIGVNLARGRAPECHCFGQLHSAPAGWPTLARNAALAALAGGVLWYGRADAGASAVGWAAGLAPREAAVLAVGAALVVAVAGEGWLLLHVLRQNGRLLARVEALEAGATAAAPGAPQAAGLPVGSPAPAFQLPGLYGETLTLDALRAPGKPVVLVFSDPGCGPCNGLMPDLGRWQREEAALTVAVLSRGTAAANRAKSVEHGLSRVLLQADREVAAAYRAAGTPSAVLIRPDGTIGGALAQGAGGSAR
ncbi:MAG TPA: MauE/DoxX family redox-associated membrane protein [Thermomicrobiales bacterium]|nr:MauE/DoxX family redox-associated membrane protein [Thermomicrobiales bacterium]